MLKWTRLAESFISQCRVQDLVLLKICLYCAGIMMGAALPKQIKKPIVFGAMGLFIATYLPLALKLIKLGREEGMICSKHF